MEGMKVVGNLFGEGKDVPSPSREKCSSYEKGGCLARALHGKRSR